MYGRLANRFSNDETGEIMLLGELIRLLTNVLNLIDQMDKQADFIGKDKVQQYLRWSAAHIANDIWETTIYKRTE